MAYQYSNSFNYLREKKSSGSGRHCVFAIRDGVGLKYYHEPGTRDLAYRQQRALNRMGLAPACEKRFTEHFPDTTVFGYETEVIEGYPNVDDFEEWELYSAARDAFGREFKLHLPGLITRCRNAGVKFDDQNDFNTGFRDGVLLILDTGTSGMVPEKLFIPEDDH